MRGTLLPVWAWVGIGRGIRWSAFVAVAVTLGWLAAQGEGIVLGILLLLFAGSYGVAQIVQIEVSKLRLESPDQ